MAAVDDVAALAKAVGQDRLHLPGLLKRHGIQVFVELWNEALAESPDDARSFDAVFVVFEALFGRQSCHADVIARLAIPSRVTKVHDVNRMMIKPPRPLRLGLLLHPKTGDRPSVPVPAAFAESDRSVRAA